MNGENGWLEPNRQSADGELFLVPYDDDSGERPSDKLAEHIGGFDVRNVLTVEDGFVVCGCGGRFDSDTRFLKHLVDVIDAMPRTLIHSKDGWDSQASYRITDGAPSISHIGLHRCDMSYDMMVDRTLSIDDDGCLNDKMLRLKGR